MIAFLCPECGKGLKVKEEYAGRQGRCPYCQQTMTVPSGTDANRAESDDASAADPKTMLPPSLDAGRDPKTILPAVPRGDPEVPQGGTIVPDAAVTKNPAIGLYDFLAPPEVKGELGRLGGYRVLKVLGTGGMGVVFLAEDTRLKRLVALKAMLPALAASAGNRERFLREARSAAAIEHDHIVAIYQVDEDRGVPFLTMPLLRGESLEERLKRERRLPIPDVLRIARETAEGLAAAHARNMIHRDIKPANIWLEGDKGRVKILDFGLARSVRGESQLTQQGAIIGTPAYMAPEQAGGKPADNRCDLFSLGCVLYRMATGTLPFKGADAVSTLVAVATETPTVPRKLNPAVPPRLSKLIMELLAKDPNGRPPSALSVVDLLAEMEREPPPERTPVEERSAIRVQVIREDRHDTIRALAAGEPMDDEFDGRRPSRSMLPWLIGGGVALLGIFLVALIGILVAVLKKSDAPEVAAKPPVENITKQPLPFNPPPNPIDNPGRVTNPKPADDPIRKPKSGAEEGVNNPKPGDTDPAEIKPKPKPKKDGPREPDKIFKPYSSAVKGLIFAPDGQHFFSHADNNSRVDYRALSTGRVVHSFDLGNGSVRHCLISPDGSRVLAYNDNVLLAWEVDGKRDPVAKVTAPTGSRIVGAGFTADKNVRAALAALIQNVGIVQVFDNATNKFIMLPLTPKKSTPLQLRHPGEVYRVFFGPDSRRVVTFCQDYKFRTGDLETRREGITSTAAPGREKSLAVSANFKRVLGTFHQANVRVFDLDGGTELHDIKPQEDGDTDAVAFGGDSSLGVAGGWGGITRVLDLIDGKVVKELKAGSVITAVALSPDGKTVLSGDMGGTMYVHKLGD
jgi:serine/threonine protein kinase